MDQAEHTTAQSFEQLYLKERKKTRIFMATTGVALVLSLGSLIYASNKKTEVPEPTTFGNGPMTPFNDEGGGGQMRMQMDITRFLNDDGSVDTGEVNDMLERMPDDFREDMLERLGSQIDEAQTNGDITADQATALKQAFSITGDTSES